MDNVYSVYDSVAELFLPPFTFSNDREAIRMFATCANDSNHSFYKNPNDFCLYIIGTWDNKSGVISPFINTDRKNLGLAKKFIIPEA